MSDSPLKQRWQDIQAKVDKLSMRERVLVLLGVIAIVYMIWDVVLFSPIADAKQKVDRDVAAMQQKIDALEDEEKTLLLALSADPDRELKQVRDQLQLQVQELDRELSELSAGLIPVEQLAAILQEVLTQTGVLKLQLLQTLPVEELQITAVNETTENSYNASAGVYKHTVALTVKGQYFQLLEYLKKLEAMNWRFYWDELRFERDEYPNGIIYLKVYTLSTDEGLLGV